MSRPKHERVQCLQNGGKKIYARAGRPLTVTEPNAAPACSTYDSARMQGLSTTEGSARFLSPVHCQEQSGRAFNPLIDTTRARAQNIRFYSPDRSSGITNDSEDTSYYFFKSPTESSGRPINPFFDVPGNRLARVQQQQQARKQLSQRESRLNLECKMAKNKEIALQRLREEQQLAACDARPQAQLSNMIKGTRQQLMAKERNRQSQERIPNGYTKPALGYRNAGQKMDINRVYCSNVVALSSAGTAGRQMEIDRDLTYRRLNLPTPKQQRARSSPTSVRGDTPNSSVQRLPKVHPRPVQSAHVSPSRSISPSEVRFHDTPEHQTETRSIQKKAEKLTKPAHQIDTSSVIEAFNSPQKSPHMSPERANESSLRSQEMTARQNSQYSSNVSQDYSPQLDTAYGQIPSGAIPGIRNSLKTPSRPTNATDEFTNTTFNTMDVPASPASLHPDQIQSKTLESQESEVTITDEIIANQMSALLKAAAAPDLDPNNETFKEMQRICCSMKQGSPTQRPTAQSCPEQESFYYNASSFNEPNYYGRKPNVDLQNCYVDLANETQYILDDMDISNEEPPICAPHSIRHGERGKLSSWSIPPEDLTCIDRSSARKQSTLRPSTMEASLQITSRSYETLGNELDSTQYLELPSSLKAPSYYTTQICRPCEQPKASLFRCLAKKLGSIYSFLSSFVAPQKSNEALQSQVMNQTNWQMCDDSNFAGPDLYRRLRCEDATNGSRNLYEKQGTKRVNEPPASVKECDHAERCGHVRYNSLDKRKIQDYHCNALRKAQIENLVNDTYCPDIIQDTVDGQTDFNKYSFDMSFGPHSRDNVCCQDPSIADPMTLLEAFSMRIDKERAEIVKHLKKDYTEEQTVESIKEHFANQNPSDLNRSIKSFLLSERLKDQEQANEAKGTSFEADVQKWATAWPGNINFKFISYIGLTKPSKQEDDEETAEIIN